MYQNILVFLKGNAKEATKRLEMWNCWILVQVIIVVVILNSIIMPTGKQLANLKPLINLRDEQQEIRRKGEISSNTSNGGGIISSASECSVSLSYQSIPYKSIKEYDLLADTIQPYGKMLWRIINLSQSKIVTNTNITLNYYNTLL